MSEYEFTSDWFTKNIPLWEQLKSRLPEGCNFLEIGSYEGRSTVWIANNFRDGSKYDAWTYITCIDTWEGGEEHNSIDMKSVEQRFNKNVAELEATVNKVSIFKIKKTSTDALAELLYNGSMFGFIYIDGSHVASDVLTDAVMAWNLLVPGGLMVFDDYAWTDVPSELHRPKMAIDTFCVIFSEQLDIIHVGYQVVVQKKFT